MTYLFIFFLFCKTKTKRGKHKLNKMAAVTPINPVGVLHPALKTRDRAILEVPIGPTEYRLTQQTNNSSTFTNTTFAIKPTNPGTFISPVVMIQWKLFIGLNVSCNAGANGVTVWDTPGKITLNSFPMAHCMNNVEININGQTTTCNVQEIIDVMQRVGWTDQQLSIFASKCPTAPDYYAYFDQGREASVTQTTNINAGNLVNGNLLDPMSGYGNYTGKGINRGSWRVMSTNGPGGPIVDAHTINAGQTFTFWFETEVWEPLYVPPLNKYIDEFGLTQMANLDIKITCSSANQLICHNHRASTQLNDANNDLNRIEINSVECRVDPAKTYVHYISYTPNPVTPITRQPAYPHAIVKSYPTISAETYTPQRTRPQRQRIVIQSITLGGIPDVMYVVVQPSAAWRSNGANRPWELPAGFARIDQITVGFGNRSNLLSNCTTDDLYHQAVQNGLNYTFTQWNEFIGSVVILRPGDNIPLPTFGDAPGVGMTTNLNMDIYYTPLVQIPDGWPLGNIGAFPIQYQANIIVIYGAVLWMSQGNMNIDSMPLNPVLVMNASNAPSNGQMTPFENMYGAGLLKKLKKGANRVANFAKKHNVVSRGINIAKKAGFAVPGGIRKMVKQAGYGSYGGSMRGGALLSKENLKRTVDEAYEQEDEDEDEDNNNNNNNNNYDDDDY
jgi:hypothetical protein